MPLFMIMASKGLTILYFADFAWSWEVFRALWVNNAIAYLFVTLMSFTIDPQTAGRTWIQGVMFRG
jgi:hypothetical protein